MNISKKTRKKIQSILLSDHFGESGEYISMRGFSYTPAPDSPLSVIWKKFVVRLDGEIIGYLFDDKCKYISAGSCARRKVAQVIRSPEQFFHPRCHFARQSKQIAFRLKKMGEDKLARLFDDDAALLLIINMWNLEIEDDDFSFVTQDMISPILEIARSLKPVPSAICTQGRDGWIFCLGTASWKSASTARRVH